MKPPELPPESVLEGLAKEVEANRLEKPDDARAITLVMAVRSLLDARRNLNATGHLSDVDLQLAMRCLGIFVTALKARSGEPS